MFTVCHGDMFSAPSDAYAHGVNVRGVMGAGVAAIVARRWPQCRAVYAQVCHNGDFPPGQTLPLPIDIDGRSAWLYNCASQDEPGPYAREEWLTDSLNAAYYHADTEGVRTLSLPLIGGGIGGLDPVRAQEIIQEVAQQWPRIDTTLWLWP